MKPETRLDFIVFQLTPTRTRCDLVITAKGKTEKVASGLLDPFLAHLKAAQDQIAKGGYSITLEPDPQTGPTWFTKATVERFVRFVNSPGILERVNTIESEILQIQEAIEIQGKEGVRGGNGGDHPVRPVNETGVKPTTHVVGSKPPDADSEKAIVIYKPGAISSETNGSVVPEESSKVQLLRVLETRKSVLQKEQGMAFARAIAAGFAIDQMPSLMSFSECFGAARLLMACRKFVTLWKQKHESGQWVEIEAAEAMSTRSDLFPMHPSGIVVSGDDRKQKDDKDAWPNSIAGNLENSGKTWDSTDTATNPQQSSLEYAQGQFQHPMFPQWPGHAPPGFQPYPLPGMPYYGPFYPPPYGQMEDHRFNGYHRRKTKSHSVKSEDSDVESEVEEEDDTPSSEGRNRSEQEKDVVHQGSRRKLGRTGKKKSGMVVIRNINYIAPKRQNASENESESPSQPGSDEESRDLQYKNLERKNKKSSQNSKGKLEHAQTVGTSQTPDKEDNSGNWEVFQSFLLRNEDNFHADGDRSMFSGEKVHATKKKLRNTAGSADPLFPPDRYSPDAPERNVLELDAVNGKTLQRNRHLVANYELSSSSEGRNIQTSSSNVKLQEMEGRSGYLRGSSDDFIMSRREKHLNADGSVDFYAENERRLTGCSEIGSCNQANDEFVVSCRSTSQEQFGRNPNAVDIESELPFARRIGYSDPKIKNLRSYEPHDLSLMPKRDRESEPISYDPAIHYDIEEHAGNKVLRGNNIKDKDIKAKPGLKRTDKDKSAKSLQNPLEKRRMEPVRKGKPSKLNPLAEAQARAEKLRAFKADLLKAKKEKEEEELKRLEALKRERQKRIAARSTQPSPAPLANRAQVPSKVYSNIGSKFRDSSPRFSSPLQRLPIRRASTGSIDTKKITKSSILSAKKDAGGDLIKPVLSVPESRKESNGVLLDKKTIRRFSEPKGSAAHRSSSVKSSRDLQISKRSSLGRNDAPQGSSLKIKGNVNGPNKRALDVSQNSKISAIMNLDKSKSATLPELKTKSSGNSVTMPFGLSRKVIITRDSETKMPVHNNSKGKKIADSYTELTDDSLVIEKSVVTSEKDIFPDPVIAVEDKVNINDYSNYKTSDRNGVSEYPKVHAPPSPVTFDVVGKDKKEIKIPEKPISCEVKTTDSDKSIFIPSEKPYQAPHARVTSLEDTVISNFNHVHDLPSNVASETNPHVGQAYVSNNSNTSSVVDSPEMFVKSGKESSKGLKKLLKFGRKSHNPTSSEGSIELEGSSTNNHMVASEVSTLKTLISEDDSSSGGIHAKSSRSFSIFSPFRSKSSEKKLSM